MPEKNPSRTSSIPLFLPFLRNRDRNHYRYQFVSGKKSPSSSNSRQTMGILRSIVENYVSGTAMWVSKLRSLRWATLVLGISNLVVVVLGSSLLILASKGCAHSEILPFAVVLITSAVRIMSMIGIGIAQEATAATILSSPNESVAADVVIRHERRMRYKRWLWWTRLGMVLTVFQFVGATYLMLIILKYIYHNGKSSGCFLGPDPKGNEWEQHVLVLFIIMLWFQVIVQCITGSDVLRWRSFYATHDNAWKAHYREVFDHGIREALCCLGRVKYLSVLEEDEVYSVARLLGDLVAYRASGTGHLELLAGLALLQRHRQSANSYEEFVEAPEEKIREAAALHQFAEAAYTGPLLDFGRNPILFPCAWLYRQGVLTPWTRSRRPVLEGDNWWRGHAAAFLKYVNLPPEALRQGRVNQAKCEAAYFIVVLHHLRSIVIAVRGTETPEDLITDGLCRECILSVEDLDGLINSNNVDLNVKQSVISSIPHYGHSGIVEAARELYTQIDGQPGDKDNLYDTTGFLSSLLGAGCECHGYSVRIVGHSLGGAIGALLGLRLYHRHPNLHVYAYGALPCVDSVVAEACSGFITSIVYNDEFSSRLSVSSILRLRAAAITALSQDSSSDSAMICKLARRILHISNHYTNKGEAVSSPSFQSGALTTEEGNQHTYRRHYKYAIKGGVFLCAHAISCMLKMPKYQHCCLIRVEGCKLSSAVTLDMEVVSDKKGSAFTTGDSEQDQGFSSREVPDFTENPNAAIQRENYDEIICCGPPNTCTHPSFGMPVDVLSCKDPVSEFMDVVPSSEEVSARDPPEMFLPGLVIHIVLQHRSLLPSWKGWRIHEREHNYKAYIAYRERFKDIIVSPYMFLDHLPWRCHYAMQKVLGSCKAQAQLHESSMV